MAAERECELEGAGPAPVPRDGAGFAGKPSTKWAPDTVHDFMHAKITVADDVSFVGSFNLSHSGEMNAENVLEIKDAAIADRLAAFVTRSARSTR